MKLKFAGLNASIKPAGRFLFGQPARRGLGGILLFCACFTLTRAQSPNGVFLTDTVEIGKPFRYSLSIRHRPNIDVLFPDTARHFAPFLVRDMTIFSTETSTRGSLDSAVYTLITFETRPVQTLEVPVWLLRTPTDCTLVRSSADTVRLRERIQTQRPDTLRLATHTKVVVLKQQMNYPLLMIILMGLCALAGVLFLFFGGNIRTRIRRYQLYRQYMSFQRSFDRLTRNIGPETAPKDAGRAVVLWRKYMERIESKPFTSLTTREIAELVQDNRLADALKEIDGAIYGGVYSDHTQQSLRILSEVADSAYRRNSVHLVEAHQEATFD
ncbi:hypothetical protein LX87_02965 [Larkinella arboricola]|uniref:Uncharacterized protein n=1 Tax=Larkinella arboricola TaxID=643671 RepID=A0A327WXM6_LARAB|nr:hypothetical protein [Larkinella arboricola]RAJ98057.1 hypothetical protein LX87_02965 [Larkinella arboricola]